MVNLLLLVIGILQFLSFSFVLLSIDFTAILIIRLLVLVNLLANLPVVFKHLKTYCAFRCNLACKPMIIQTRFLEHVLRRLM